MCRHFLNEPHDQRHFEDRDGISGHCFPELLRLIPFRHVRTYFGRIHEPRFLSGIVAGAMTRADRLGYIATCPTPEVISGINAFGLGARLVNPRAEVFVIGPVNGTMLKIQKREHDYRSKASILYPIIIPANRKFPENMVYIRSCAILKTKPASRILGRSMWNWDIL